MKINKLRSYQQPDLSGHVIHFTGRTGIPNDEVSTDIRGTSARGRLVRILEEGAIVAHRVFWVSGPPVVCFTECSPAGISTLVAERRYRPYGVAFTKDFVFAAGGGPALYIRGDEWDQIGCLPPEMRARCTPYWPGAEPDSPGEYVFDAVNEYTHEREWRVRGGGDPPAFRFQPEDVAFLVIGDWSEQIPLYRCVRIDSRAGVIEDPDAIWLLPEEPARLEAI
jgi:hypothetical protein